MARRSKLAKVALLPASWALTAGAMLRDQLADPYDPARIGTSAYGHNHAGALSQGLWMTLIELAIVTAIVRPWSYERSWGRSTLVLVALLPWTLVSMVLTMHAGGVFVLHFLWLVGLSVGMLVAAIWSGIATASQPR